MFTTLNITFNESTTATVKNWKEGQCIGKNMTGRYTNIIRVHCWHSFAVKICLFIEKYDTLI